MRSGYGLRPGYFVRLVRNNDDAIMQYAYGSPGETLETVFERLFKRIREQGFLG